MKFEWDLDKAESNYRKHGVTFEQGKEIFYDIYGLDLYDELHSDKELRYIRVGLSSDNELLVIYTVRDEFSETYRIISTRRAEKNYEKIYWQERNRH